MQKLIVDLKLGMNDRRTSLVRRVYKKLDRALPTVTEQDDFGTIHEYKEDMTVILFGVGESGLISHIVHVQKFM